jgi:prepilin-type processing-associated H-X9-DG protein
LIELLVVIAIIAILAAMLFPVFARARESARKIQCLSNVKNIATAIQMYLADYDRFPPEEHRAEALAAFKQWTAEDRGCDGVTYRATWGNPFLRWQVVLDEYVRNRDVWRCPSSKWNPSSWWIVPQYKGDFLKYLGDTHGDLWTVRGSSPGGSPCSWAFPSGWGGDVTDSIGQQAGNVTLSEHAGMFDGTISVTSANNMDLKTSQINDPAWFVVGGDGTQFGTVALGISSMLYERCALPCGGADWTNCPWTAECGLDPSAWDKWWTDATYRAKDTRHLGGSNLGFADGHAGWFMADAAVRQHRFCDPRIDYNFTNEDGKFEGLCGKF